MVIDSGPIIRLASSTALFHSAKTIYTVPAVLQEIRDARARQHLETLPFELQLREASASGIRAVVDFSKQTGDYASLSKVDIQVLALLYDLETERCGAEHIRKTPKRVVGLGKIEKLPRANGALAIDEKDDEDSQSESSCEEDQVKLNEGINRHDFLPVTALVEEQQQPKPSSWAQIVSPSATAEGIPGDARLSGTAMSPFIGRMRLQEDDLGGQFSDADETDEASVSRGCNQDVEDDGFPTLKASLSVPYEGSHDEDDDGVDVEHRRQQEEQRKLDSLKPVSKSGQLYNSFRKYNHLMKPKLNSALKKPGIIKPDASFPTQQCRDEVQSGVNPNQSRIAGANMQEEEFGFDDGEGWISTVGAIHSTTVAGAIGPSKCGLRQAAQDANGPPIGHRTACATTDFAMQNVILQMNLVLISVDGVEVRKVKSWVTRCGACFKVYTSQEQHTGPGNKRLFCSHCGSDFLQKIAASVDGKTGRLRLHLSRRYKHNLRGTKFSMPKPGSGNRFQGDLLLREDQLLMGAWNQKLKMSSGGKAKSDAQSMFGKDIASNVGCHTSSLSDDIQVGFGHRNPNSARGRERRGKKKKSSDRACGLRRY